MTTTKRNCDNCGKQYQADNRNLKRGWGLCCSKSCAAKKREMSRPDYNPERVKYNNLKRAGLLPRQEKDIDYVEMYNNSSDADNDQWGDCEFGIHQQLTK